MSTTVEPQVDPSQTVREPTEDSLSDSVDQIKEEGDEAPVNDLFYNHIRSIDRLLLPHFFERHFPRFREMQAVTGLVISGSTALNFLTTESQEFNDLDLYVDLRGAEYAAAWLELVGCKAQYRMEPLCFQRVFRRKLSEVLDLTLEDVRASASQELQEKIAELEIANVDVTPSAFSEGRYYSSPHILTVVDFYSPKRSKIQLVICISGVMDCIMRFHSTHVMNFVTAHACFCLYPQETLQMRMTLSFNRKDDKTLHAYRKYRQRGWIYVSNEDEAVRCGVFPSGERAIGSTGSLVVPISPSMPDISRHFDRVYSRTTFDLVYGDFMAGEPYIAHDAEVVPVVRILRDIDNQENDGTGAQA